MKIKVEHDGTMSHVKAWADIAGFLSVRVIDVALKSLDGRQIRITHCTVHPRAEIEDSLQLVHVEVAE